MLTVLSSRSRTSHSAQKWAKSVGIENFRVYATITNPLVIQKSDLLKNYDPEMDGGIDYPLTKQFVFGVNLTF